MIQLFEANRRNPGTPLTNIRNFGNPNHTCFGWMHWFCHARGLHTSAKCPPGTVPTLHEPQLPYVWLERPPTLFDHYPAWAWAPCHGDTLQQSFTHFTRTQLIRTRCRWRMFLFCLFSTYTKDLVTRNRFEHHVSPESVSIQWLLRREFPHGTRSVRISALYTCLNVTPCLL